MTCHGCGRDEELRLGYCFDCAISGERRAAHRTVLQHLKQAFSNATKRYWFGVKCDLKWAAQRMLRVGDYAKGGYFDSEGHDWRN